MNSFDVVIEKFTMTEFIKDNVVFSNYDEYRAYAHVKLWLDYAKKKHQDFQLGQRPIVLHLDKNRSYYTARRIFNLLGSDERLILVVPRFRKLVAHLVHQGWKNESFGSNGRILEQYEFRGRISQGMIKEKVILYTEPFPFRDLGTSAEINQYIEFVEI